MVSSSSLPISLTHLLCTTSTFQITVNQPCRVLLSHEPPKLSLSEY